MNLEFKQLFMNQWKKYFAQTELPITFFYRNQVSPDDLNDSKNEHRCLIGNLNRVRDGHTFVYRSDSPGCLGGKRYTGFSQKLRPHFEYFLSCGIPGEMEGERYKKSPELVKELLENSLPFKAPEKYLVFKRWDKLTEEDQPLIVVFFAPADVLSGLFTLANFDIAHRSGVVAPMGSGCASIVSYPYEELNSEHPHCILGMFDVSARPCVPAHVLTFAIPMPRFEEMIRNMDSSFLTTHSWDIVKERLVRINE
jgi:hypothetical protein